MNEKIIRAIRSALGSGIHHFEIRFSELLVEDGDYYSATFSFNPNQIENQEFKVVGGIQNIQFDVTDSDVSIIFGEDDEMEVTALNIYKMLYWSEVTKPLD